MGIVTMFLYGEEKSFTVMINSDHLRKIFKLLNSLNKEFSIRHVCLGPLIMV